MRKLANVLCPVLVSLLTSATGFANDDPEVIATIQDRGFTLFDNGERVFGCSRYDRNSDGVKETTTIWVRLGKALSKREAPGILQNPYIENSFEEADNTTCRNLKKIEASTAHSFGAVYGTFDSVVTLGDGELHEAITITLRESPLGLNRHDDLATVTLSTEVTKNLGESD